MPTRFANQIDNCPVYAKRAEEDQNGVNIDQYYAKKADLPTVNDGTLTIQKNGTTVNTFSANSSSDKTVNIEVPTKTSDLQNDTNFITASDAPVQDVKVNGSSVVDEHGVANVDLSSLATKQEVTDGLATKQDTINDLSDIRSGAEKGATSVQGVEVDGTSVVNANGVAEIDLSDYAHQSDIPDVPVQDVEVNGASVVNANGVAEVTVPTKTSDLQNDSNFITASDIPAQQQADWGQSNSSAVDYIRNKPQNLVQDANYVHTDNNYTDQDEAKLAGIEAGAEVNVQSDWAQADSNADDYIKNKPQNLVQDANYVHTDNNYTDQDEAKLAGIEAGAEVNVQSDWSQSDSSADDYIKNKPAIPTKTSDLQNDSDFITSSDVPVQDVQVNGSSVVSNGVASIDVPVLAEGSNVHITQNGRTFTIAADDTTYTAGDGIQIINNQISVDADALNIDYWHGGSSSTIVGTNLNTGVSAVSYRGSNIYASSGAITLKKGTYAVHAFVKVNNNSISIDPNLYKFSINGGITGGSPIRTVEFDNSFTHEEVYELTFMTLNTSTTDAALVLTTDALTALAGLNVSLPYIQVYCLNGLVGVSGGSGGTANVAITSSDHSVTVQETTIGDTSSFDLSVPQQVQANWQETNQSSKAFIQNKPSIPTKTSDLTNDSGFITSSDVPTQQQADWNQSDSSAVDYIKNKPAIPAAQVQSDWNQSNSSAVDYIQNKPSIPTKTSDLQNDSGFITSSDVPAQQQADWSETVTTDPSYIQNKPEEMTLVAGTNVTITPDAVNHTLTIAASGSTQIQSDWTESDNTDPSYIQNKPTSTTLVAGANITLTPDAVNHTLTIAAASYSAGNMISLANDTVAVSTTAGITDIQLVNALPAQPVATVLYLIPET